MANHRVRQTIVAVASAGLALAAGGVGPADAQAKGATPAGTPTTTTAAAAARQRDQSFPIGSRPSIDVAVATLWKQPRIHRRSDQPSTTNPVELAAWIRSLRSTADRRWLVSRIQTQALYGQEVVVRAHRGRWSKVAVVAEPDPQDPLGYPGWLPTRQLAPAEKTTDTDDDVAGTWVAVLTKTARLHFADRDLKVSYGTRLTVDPSATNADPSALAVITPDGPATVAADEVGPPLEPTRASVMSEGRRFLGIRYIWGGLSTWGFDCSGLIWDLFRAHGMTIPRDADPQFRAGRRVSLKRLKPADLLFWGTREYVHHVALYAGKGKMLETPSSAGWVRVVPVRWDGLVGARRYLDR